MSMQLEREAKIKNWISHNYIHDNCLSREPQMDFGSRLTWAVAMTLRSRPDAKTWNVWSETELNSDFLVL